MIKQKRVLISDIDREEFDPEFLGTLPEIERSVVKQAARSLVAEIERDGPNGQQNDILKLHRTDEKFVVFMLRSPAIMVDELRKPCASSQIFKHHRMQTSLQSKPSRKAETKHYVDFETRVKLRDWKMLDIIDKRVRRLNCSQRTAMDLADDENDSGDRIEYLVTWEKSKKWSNSSWIPRQVAKKHWPNAVAAFERDYVEGAKLFIPEILKKKKDKMKAQQLPRISASDGEAEQQLHDLTTALAGTFFRQINKDKDQAHATRAIYIWKAAEKGHEIARSRVPQDDIDAVSVRHQHAVADELSKMDPQLIYSLENLADRKVYFDKHLLATFGQELLQQERRTAFVDRVLAKKYETSLEAQPHHATLESEFDFACTISQPFTWGSEEN